MAAVQHPVPSRQELMVVKKNATYSLPISVYLWIKNEAAKRKTDASSLIVELVEKEQTA